MIDLNKAGKYPAKIKITAVEPPANGKTYGFASIEGYQNKFLYSTKRSAIYGTPLEVGAEGEAEIEVTERDYQGQKQFSAWISSFGGLKGKSWGGKTFTPKEFFAELAPSIGGIYQRGIDKDMDPTKIETYARSYEKIMREIKEKA